MKRKHKRAINAVFILLSSLLYFLLALKGCSEQNIDLTSCRKITSTVVSADLGYRQGGSRASRSWYSIQLKDYENRLGVFRKSQNYNDLSAAVMPGDTVTAYFLPGKVKKSNTMIDLIQLEKRGSILFSKTEYEDKESILIYVGLCAGIFTVIVSILYYRNDWFRRL